MTTYKSLSPYILRPEPLPPEITHPCQRTLINAIGKKLVKIVKSNYNNQWVLIFDDNTHCAISTYHITDEDVELSDNKNIDLADYENTNF